MIKLALVKLMVRIDGFWGIGKHPGLTLMTGVGLTRKRVSAYIMQSSAATFAFQFLCLCVVTVTEQGF